MHEFEWDDGNSNKNYLKHDVSDQECEEVFFDPNKKQLLDTLHSNQEVRFILLGQTKSGKVLFVVYTIRHDKIRVISARPLNIRERHLYEEKN